MKALAVVFFVLLAIGHPMALAAVLAAELGVCAAIGWLIWRAVPLGFYRLGRTA